MKTLKIKSTEIILDDEGNKTTYKNLIQFCLNMPPQGGWDLKTMRERFRIEDALEKANGTLKLEDADTEILKAVVKSMKWNLRHKDIIQFCDDVEAL